MNKIATGVLLGLGLANATERYIIQYDDAAWSSLHLNSLPDNTIDILHNVQMTIAELSADEVAMYSEIPGITVHKETPVEMFKGGVQESPKDWGIDRIDQQSLPLDRKYRYGTDGEGTDVYIVDTGIKVTHNEFGGRATWDKNFAQDGVDDDCQGHGTHVASSVGGTTTGVAKKARIHAVKVLGCNGSGTNVGVIAGINYVVGTQLRNRQQKSVLNMSLGGGKNEPINAACQAAVKAGVVVVVAAGNENSDACHTSPASAPDVITVAASDINDKYASFSNWGKCVTLYAPGKDIYGAWIGSNSEYKTISGTSMASPHTAGVAALVLASGQAKTPKEVKEKLVAVASKNKINPVQRDTPNLLLYADPSWTTQGNESEHSKFSFRSLNNLN